METCLPPEWTIRIARRSMPFRSLPVWTSSVEAQTSSMAAMLVRRPTRTFPTHPDLCTQVCTSTDIRTVSTARGALMHLACNPLKVVGLNPVKAQGKILPQISQCSRPDRLSLTCTFSMSHVLVLPPPDQSAPEIRSQLTLLRQFAWVWLVAPSPCLFFCNLISEFLSARRCCRNVQ